jgi:phage major head subunit gpT-like protein
MDINKRNMDLFFKVLSNKFRAGLDVAPPVDLSIICEDMPVSTDETDFSWLGETDDLREWKNGRELRELAAYKYSIKNKEYEHTLRVKLRDIENDHTGLYGTRAEKQGRAAGRWKMLRILEALQNASSTPCFDGQNFFDTDHPCVGANGAPTTFANLRTGAQSASPFYLFDNTHVLKPLMFQSERPVFEALTNPNTSDHVFMHREALYGARAYGGAGYTFPQYAFKSENAFSETEFKTIRAAMEAFRNDQGQLVGASPTLLVYGRGQRDTIEDALYNEKIGVTENGNAGSPVQLRRPNVFSGLQTMYIKFLP